MTRLDVCWLGRQPGLLVRNSRDIVRSARWGWPIFVAKCVGIAVSAAVVVAVIFLATD